MRERSLFGLQAVAFVGGANAEGLIGISMFFLVVLDDGLGRRVVNAESFGDLSRKREPYIDDAPALLNAS